MVGNIVVYMWCEEASAAEFICLLQHELCPRHHVARLLKHYNCFKKTLHFIIMKV